MPVKTKKKIHKKLSAPCSGKAFENQVLNILIAKGIQVVRAKDPKPTSGDYVIVNAPFDSWYGCMDKKNGRRRKARCARTEFLLCIENCAAPDGFDEDYDGYMRVRIDCKFQCTLGTAERKIGLTVDELHWCIEEPNAIVLMGGNGFDPSLIEIAKEIAVQPRYLKDRPKFKPTNLHIYSLTEFRRWLKQFFN